MSVIIPTVPIHLPGKDDTQIREPEPWQFENPILRVSIKEGRVLHRRDYYEGTRLRTESAQPAQPADPTQKEGVDEMVARDLQADELLKQVAELYNLGVPVKQITQRFGIHYSTLYRLVKKAHRQGFIPELRSGPTRTPNRAVTSKVFAEDVAGLEIRLEQLKRQYEVRRQAAQIARAISELLGEAAAQPVLAELKKQLEAVC